MTPILLRHARTHIKMPTTRNEVRQVHQVFHAVARIPRVIGGVDGTLIPIHNPSRCLYWVWGDHRALCVTYALIKRWVIDLPGID